MCDLKDIVLFWASRSSLVTNLKFSPALFQEFRVQEFSLSKSGIKLLFKKDSPIYRHAYLCLLLDISPDNRISKIF